MEENQQGQLSENLQPQPVQQENYYQSNPEGNNIYTPPTLNTIITSNVPQAENKSNQNTYNNNSDTNSLWYDLSILSWFLFLCAGLTSYKEHLAPQDYYQPVGAYLTLVIGLITTIGTIGFIIYFKNTTLNKNQNMLNGMLGEMSKYHSVCLFLVTLLLISLNNPGRKASYVFSLIFSTLSYGSLFFIYLKTEFEANWYEMLTTKKGLFSCLIAFSFYSIFYSIGAIGSWKKEDGEDFVKGSGISFSILIGLGNLGFAFFFKDILVAITNFLIYFEMGKYFYDNKPSNIKADGVIDIIMAIASSGVIFYLLFKERDSLYRS